MKPNRIKSILKLSVKVVLVGLLIYFLTKKGLISLSATRQAFSRLDKIIPAMMALVFTTFLSIFRWQLLLGAQNIRISWVRTFQLTYVGNFFNIALPGAVSGDFVKAFYVAKETQGQRGRAFGSILFDRLAGLSALAMVSTLALFFGLDHFLGTPLFRAVWFLMVMAFAGILTFYGYLFLVRERHDPLLKFLRKLEKRFKKAGSLLRTYEGLRHYHNHRWTVIQVLLVSMAIHLTVCFACVSFAEALGEPNVPWIAIFVVVPLGLLVTAIPILPAGVGTGHAAFGWLFLLLGSQRGADIFSLYALTQIMVGAIGGLIYLRFKTHHPELVVPSVE